MSLAAFDRAITFALFWETAGRTDGAPHDDPHDPGGFTKWGIAQSFHPDLDVPSLTRSQAVELYFNDYWLRARCHQMIEAVAIAHFDHAVNRGVLRAGESLQRVVGAAIDGKVGLKTLAALDLAVLGQGERPVAALVVCERMRRHLDGAKDVHIRGLLRRCVALQELVLKEVET